MPDRIDILQIVPAGNWHAVYQDINDPTIETVERLTVWALMSDGSVWGLDNEFESAAGCTNFICFRWIDG